MTAALPELDGVSVRFGGLAAVTDLSIAFSPGSLTGLIGPNGAGKTTLLNAISGFTAVPSGRIAMNGVELTPLSAAGRARLGVVRGFQTVPLLERETVFDNVLVGCEQLPQRGPIGQLPALPAERRCRARDLAATEATLHELGLLPIADRPVNELPFASRRLTEIARLPVVRPAVLMLDEPAARLDTRDRRALIDSIRTYHDAGGLTTIVIEHDIELVRRLCPYRVALDMGHIIATGAPGEVLNEPAVKGISGREAVLRLQELRAWYGGIQALFDVSFSLDQGDCMALVGTNGSGKTTIVRSLLGLIRTAGEIRLDGQDLSPAATHQRVRRHRSGVVHEGRGLFLRMSVLENILVGWSARERSRVDTALAHFPSLANRLQQPAGLLSGGEQQLVALARAVVLRPRLLLLDEPTLGLAPVVIDEIYGYPAKLREAGLTMLLVEQSVRRASAFADRLCLIRNGRSVLTAEGRNPAAEAELVRLAFAEADRPDQRQGDER